MKTKNPPRNGTFSVPATVRTLYAIPGIIVLIVSASVWFWQYNDFRQNYNIIAGAYLLLMPFLGLIGARAWGKLRADTFILTGESITRPASRTVINFEDVVEIREYFPIKSFHTQIQIRTRSKDMIFISGVKRDGKFTGDSLTSVIKEAVPGVEFTTGVPEKTSERIPGLFNISLAGFVVPLIIIFSGISRTKSIEHEKLLNESAAVKSGTENYLLMKKGIHFYYDSLKGKIDTESSFFERGH